MAITYAEAAELMKDPVFIGRSEVACLKYATYIQNEDPGVPAHTSRLRWALATINNATQSVAQIMPVLIWDDNVQTDGGAIIDADLQTAVETSVNKFI